jgi:hypothetical protein
VLIIDKSSSISSQHVGREVPANSRIIHEVLMLSALEWVIGASEHICFLVCLCVCRGCFQLNHNRFFSCLCFV